MRESILLLVRAVIQVYVRAAMLLNNSYARNILGGTAGGGEVMERSVDGDDICAVVINTESDIAMTGTSAIATATAIAVGCESGASREIKDMGGHTTGDSTEHRGGLIKHLVMSLVFLQARCPGEADVVPDVAVRSCVCTYTVVPLHLHILLVYILFLH